jgi:hypothetical protein
MIFKLHCSKMAWENELLFFFPMPRFEWRIFLQDGKPARYHFSQTDFIDSVLHLSVLIKQLATVEITIFSNLQKISPKIETYDTSKKVPRLCNKI